MSDKTNLNPVESPPTGTSPPSASTTQFRILLILLGFLSIALGIAVVVFAGRTQKLQSENTLVKEAHQKAVKEINLALQTLDSKLNSAQAKIGQLEKELDENRQTVEALQDDLDKVTMRQEKAIAKLNTLLSRLEETLNKSIGMVQKDLTKTKESFEEKTGKLSAELAQLSDDSKYIIAELGKKAEKAYLRFMERKLKKKINKVAEQITTVQSQLEEKIAQTRQHINEIAQSISSEIEKKVEESTTLDFQPSEMDKENGH